MKERPILFSGEMVRAILAGQKTQTRRIVKSVGADNGVVFQKEGDQWIPYRSWDGESTQDRNGAETPVECPYGIPGDRLWVKETWQQFFWDELPEARRDTPRGTMGIPASPERYSLVGYRADGELLSQDSDEGPAGQPANWRPSIYMPRWASRILLEVVSVRLERLQEISEEDALAEGVNAPNPCGGCGQRRWSNCLGCLHTWAATPIEAYRDLWESINGKGSWDRNPWVWVIEFRREVRP